MSHSYPTDYDLDTLTADPEIKEPGMFKVVFLNDDFTPMDFVIDILMQVFHKNFNDAKTLMFQVHYQGSAVAGIYPREIAETKAEQVIASARGCGHPLQCVIRPQ